MPMNNGGTVKLRLTDRWAGYWFPTMPPTRLAVMRIVVCALQVLWFTKDRESVMFLIQNNETFFKPQVIIAAISAVVGEDTFRTTEVFNVIWWGAAVFGVLGCIGLFSRPSVFLCALCNWLLVAHRYSYGEKHHPEALFMIFMMAMAFAPCGRALSVDAWLKRRANGGTAPQGWGLGARLETVMWPLLTVQWLLAMAYLCAGLAKLYIGGIAWMDGQTLQGYLLQDAVRWDRPLGYWVAQFRWLCMLMSISAVMFEVSFPLVLVFRRWWPLFILAGASMHIGIFILQAAPFWQFLVLYLVWVPWEKLPLLRGNADTGLVVRIEPGQSATA